MKNTEILAHLEQIVEQLGIDLRYETGDFKGGVCRVGEEKVLIVNKKLLEVQKIALICSELAQMDLSHIFILPAVRELIENQGAKNGVTED